MKIIFGFISLLILIFPVCNILITLFTAIPMTNELYKEFPNDFDKNSSHKISALTIILNLIIICVITGIVFLFFSKYLFPYCIALTISLILAFLNSSKSTANRTDFISSRLGCMSPDLRNHFEDMINAMQSRNKS